MEDMIKSNLLTNSRKSTERKCSRLQHYLYDMGKRPIAEEDAEARDFGRAWHDVRECHYANRLRPTHEFISPLQYLAQTTPNLDPYTMSKVTALFHGWYERWNKDDEDDEILAVEVPFRYTHRNPETGGISRTWKEAGKIDDARRRGPRLLFGEAKTSSDDIQPGSEYWQRLRMDTQIAQYFQVTDFGRFDACLYDVVLRPAMRPLKATPMESRNYKCDGRCPRGKGLKCLGHTDGQLYANQRDRDETPAEFYNRIMEDIAKDPDKYYQRGEVVMLESDLIEAQHEAWVIGRQIADNNNRGTHPRNPDACRSYGRLCPFFRVCVGDVDIEDQMIFEQLEQPHPELDTEWVKQGGAE